PAVPGNAEIGIRGLENQSRITQRRWGKLALCAVLVPITVLSVVVSAQAQGTGFTPLSGIGGLTPPEVATGQAVETLCPQLNPTQTAGAVGDLQIRCTELVGNALAGRTAAARNALLPMSPEEVVAQGMSSVEASNRNIGARLAALRGVVTGIGFRRFTLQNDAPTSPGTLVASLAPIFAALSNTVLASESSPLQKLGVFVNGTLTIGDKDATSREAGFDFTSLGATFGADYRFTDNFILGIALSYMSTSADFDKFNILHNPAGGGVDARSFSVSLYGTYYVLEKFYVDGILGFGWNDYDIDRKIIYSIPATDRVGRPIPGITTVNQTAHGSPNGHQFSFSVGAGYDFNMGGFTFGPLARIEYIKLNIDGYREKINNTGNGFGLALVFDDQDVDSLLSVLGGQASYAISTGIGVLLPQVRFEWRHEFKNDSRIIRARFVSDPTRTPLNLATDAPDRNYFAIGIGTSMTFRGGASAFVYYEPVLGLAHVAAHNVVLGARWEF
ncbi:MAG: hypothetical protein C5B54_04225, partial [Acidobacteria bacterium]